MNVAPTRPRENGTRTQQDSPERSGARLVFRVFGQGARDLELEFATDDHPSLITEILAVCVLHADGSPLDSALAWDLSVSRRIEYLLCVAVADGRSGLSLALRCPEEACRQLLEINLSLGDVLAFQRRAEYREVLKWPEAETSWRFRRPTGRDQRKWRATPFPDSANAQRVIIGTLVVDENEAVDEWGTDFIQALDAALEEFDPLVAFSVRANCTQCGLSTNYPIDLEALALRELEKIQARLLREVHRLASRYHWSESEVLGLTPQRRARYLRLIEMETAP